MRLNNPFVIRTPENLSAVDTVDLFVDVFTDFSQLIEEGHAVVRGPRGVGKSMMFRYMRPDCQLVKLKCSLCDLHNLCLYIPIRNASFTRLTELGLFDGKQSASVLLEHVMICYLLSKAFGELERLDCYGNTDEEGSELKAFYSSNILPMIYHLSKSDCPIPCQNFERTAEAFGQLRSFFDERYKVAMDFVVRASSEIDLREFEEPLYSYLDSFVPLMNGLRSCSFLPSGAVFLLVDDAHALSSEQTRVLNTWISTRTSGEVSIKVSTQYDYKTFYTVTGSTIDSPHDFIDIDLSVIYTSTKKQVYRERVCKIVKRRLELSGINVAVEDFFPVDEDQEERIQKIADEYRIKHDKGEGRGARGRDDATRYARPDFIKSLGGKRKSTSTYSYAGFDQLVHISSGVIRYFIEIAYKMFAEEQSVLSAEAKPNSISPHVQTKIVKEEANAFYADLERYIDRGNEAINDSREGASEAEIKRLSNLIDGLGMTFRRFLLSDRAERRVFSVAISDEPSEEVRRVFGLGVVLGYFHRSTIGRKSGRTGGRTPLYILNRRLAPIWTLDPTSFAGYWFTLNSTIEGLMNNPTAEVRRIESKGKKAEDNEAQLHLFDDYIMDVGGEVD